MSSSHDDGLIPNPVVYFTLQNGGRRAVSFTPDHRDDLSGLVSAALTASPAVRIHAFSWTASEIRMALEGSEPARGRFARELLLRHRDTMHAQICSHECLFERVHKETPIETDRDLLDVVEHIHTAPVRAGLAEHPSDYPWSSCGAYLGITWFPWLTTELVTGLGSARRRSAGAFVRRTALSDPSEAYLNPP